MSSDMQPAIKVLEQAAKQGTTDYAAKLAPAVEILKQESAQHRWLNRSERDVTPADADPYGQALFWDAMHGEAVKRFADDHHPLSRYTHWKPTGMVREIGPDEPENNGLIENSNPALLDI